MENTSGQGKTAVVPEEAKGLAWGAFLFSWLWGLFNRTWIALLVLVPIVGLVMWVILLFKGREWAWRNKRWDSVEHFNKIQRRWAIAGLIVVLIPFIIILVLGFGLIVAFFGSMFGMQSAMDSSVKNAVQSKPEISAPATSSVKKPVSSASASAPEANPERDKIIQNKLNSIGRESFPDDANVIWNLREIVHKNDYSFVETEPTPSTVGYPRFKFVLLFKQTYEPIVVGCYSLDKGQWSLLFSNPKFPSDWQSLQSVTAVVKTEPPMPAAAKVAPPSPATASAKTTFGVTAVTPEPSKPVPATPVQTHQPLSAMVATSTGTKTLAKSPHNIGIEAKNSATRSKRYGPTDLRYCLDLPSNEAIAKCADE